MKFLTNCSDHDTNRVMVEICAGDLKRRLVVRDAHVSDTPGAWTAEQMKQNHVVGIYELEPSE